MSFWHCAHRFRSNKGELSVHPNTIATGWTMAEVSNCKTLAHIYQYTSKQSPKNENVSRGYINWPSLKVENLCSAPYGNTCVPKRVPAILLAISMAKERIIPSDLSFLMFFTSSYFFRLVEDHQDAYCANSPAFPWETHLAEWMTESLAIDPPCKTLYWLDLSPLRSACLLLLRALPWLTATTPYPSYEVHLRDGKAT